VIALRTYRRDQRGASAVEFALVVPVFVMLVFGLMHMMFVIFATVSLHNAVESTARCLSVSANNPVTATTACPSTASVQTYGQNRYVGPSISPTFAVSTTTSCTNAYQVSGSGTYNMAMGFVSFPITVSAKACFSHS
jgi:Flp pilus assembly protein TadG